MTESLFENADVIHAYSRQMAIEDGALVDVEATAREAGFKLGVCITRGAWAECVEWTREAGLQDEAGRLWDVLWMAVNGARRATGDRFDYVVLRVPNTGRGYRAKPVTLRAICGPDDDGTPCITIMLPGEE